MANNRKLGRVTDHRMAMLRALVTYLLENGKVESHARSCQGSRPAD